jgi:MFS family permease
MVSKMQKILQHGISANKLQITLQLIQVFLVGLTIGMTRTVIPGLAETEFGLGGKQFLLLTSFVVVFGIVKAVMNLLAGRLSDYYGRKNILIIGWLIAIPIPLMILYAPNWNWIIAATFLLGINQGLCWSMTINSKLDLTKLNQKGLINGLNEFSGYAAVGIAGVIMAFLVDFFGLRNSTFVFGMVVIFLGLFIAVFFIKETIPWAKHQNVITQKTSLKKMFLYATWENKILFSLNQAGLIEKFTDSLVWIFLPIYFLSKGLTLLEGSAIISIYAMVWGGSQLITGALSDKIGRKKLIVNGMFICGLGVLSIAYTDNVWLWSIEAATVGFGMAMLYPTLGAAVADFSPTEQRGSLLGVYRFWRDFGYAVSALTMGLIAQWTQLLTAPFWLAAVMMITSGFIVLFIFPNKK